MGMSDKKGHRQKRERQDENMVETNIERNMKTSFVMDLSLEKDSH